MRIRDALVAATSTLRGTVKSPRMESRLLLQATLNKDPAWLIAHDAEMLAADAEQRFAALTGRRRSGEPMAYILGVREFYGRPFRVTPDTLIPRPETEHLVEAALTRMPATTPLRVLDIGTGTGCIAATLKLERPAWHLTAVDLSPAALAVAGENCRALQAEVELFESDLFSALAGRRFHLIVSNPPYVAEADPHLGLGDVRHEPRSALAAGPEGLDVLRSLIEQAPAYLVPGGWLMVEHGYDQAVQVSQQLGMAGFGRQFRLNDLAGQVRISGGHKLDSVSPPSA